MKRQTLVIGARASALSRVQATLVGRALAAHDPHLTIRYVFKDSMGDRDLQAELPSLLRSGGFTSELSSALQDADIDVAVHSWKDLPLAPGNGTHVAATLERADARDLLLVRRSWNTRATDTLRILTCSTRRRENLRALLTWAIPGAPAKLQFAAVRGDILQRLRRLISGDGDALVVAKAAIDRLLLTPGAEFDLARVMLRRALATCRIIVLPLAANPGAPGQGALAIEIATRRRDLAARLHAINHQPTHDRVRQERARLAALADEDAALSVSIVAHPEGEAEFVRDATGASTLSSAHLWNSASPLPTPSEYAGVWLGPSAGSEEYRRHSVAVPHSTFVNFALGLLVARADALPENEVQDVDQTIWTAGLTTWRKLAARGIWVSGSDESLGESAARSVRHLYPQVTRWIKLSHAAGYDCPGVERLTTYRLERCAPLADLRSHTHFYWRSGSQFRDYLRAYPWIRGAWHGAGPGNTLAIVRAAVGPERVRAFLTAEQFSAALCAKSIAR